MLIQSAFLKIKICFNRNSKGNRTETVSFRINYLKHFTQLNFYFFIFYFNNHNKTIIIPIVIRLLIMFY